MNITLPPLHPGQRAVAASHSRFTVLCCGRRWGKTLLAICLAVRAASDGLAVLWCAPVHRTAAIAWRRVKILLRPLAAAGVVSFRESDMTLTFGRGRIDFRSAEAGDGLRGEGYGYIVADEAAMIPEQVWFEILRPMLIDSPGSRALLVSTPRLTDDWFARAYRRGLEGADGFVSFHFRSSDNPHLDAAEIEHARADMAPTAFAREILAEFVSEDAVRFPVLVTGTPPACTARSLGCDLAISERASADYTCLTIAGLAPDRTTWILHAVRGHWPFAETISQIASVATTWDARTVAVEQVAYQKAAIDELQRLPALRSFKVEGIVPRGDKLARHAPLENRVATGAIRFAASLPEWFTSEVKAFPLAKHDDSVDSFGLAVGGLASASSAQAWNRAFGTESDAIQTHRFLKVITGL